LLYENLKEYYPTDEIVISDGGSTDETIEYFNKITDPNLIFLNNGKLNLCENYNQAISNCTKNIIILLHNDMFIPPNFKQRVLDGLTPTTIMSYARIEPPVFPGEEPGKLVRDFGFDLETLNKDEIIKFSETYDLKHPGGGYLFIACHKNNWIQMDEKTFNPPQMWAADDDLHIRFRLRNLDLLISNAIVYHFVSKTSRSDASYRDVEIKSNRNFIRKWGFRQSNSFVKYNVAFVVRNCTLPMLETLEPWCDRIYIEDEMQVITLAYLEKEQSNTKFDLNKRVFHIGHNDPHGENDVVVEFDAGQLTQQNFQYIQQLAAIIADSGEIGEFQIDIFRISIYSIEEQQDQLVISKL
jgi:glycosyltransferase involved in cell wall biosynthesis